MMRKYQVRFGGGSAEKCPSWVTRRRPTQLHAYFEVLIRYHGTQAGEAAVEELLTLADGLAQQGRYYAALNIFNRLEQLC